jgi:hypothetical protein
MSLSETKIIANETENSYKTVIGALLEVLFGQLSSGLRVTMQTSKCVSFERDNNVKVTKKKGNYM